MLGLKPKYEDLYLLNKTVLIQFSHKCKLTCSTISVCVQDLLKVRQTCNEFLFFFF